jgi:hypothetical protein
MEENDEAEIELDRLLIHGIIKKNELGEPIQGEMNYFI